MHYRRKWSTTDVTAIQWTGENLEQIREFVNPSKIQVIYRTADGEFSLNSTASLYLFDGPTSIWINLGDWLIKDLNLKGGESTYYTCGSPHFKTNFQTES